MSTFKIVICHLSFVIRHLSFIIYHLSFAICHTKQRLLMNLLKGVKRVLITAVSSNINEVTRTILNFFIQNLYNHKKSSKRLQANKKVYKKHLAFCVFA